MDLIQEGRSHLSGWPNASRILGQPLVETEQMTVVVKHQERKGGRWISTGASQDLPTSSGSLAGNLIKNIIASHLRVVSALRDSGPVAGVDGAVLSRPSPGVTANERQVDIRVLN